MTLIEKAAYLKGLKDGLSLDTEKSEGKLIAEIIDIISDVAVAIDDLEVNAEAVNDELDAFGDVLEDISDYVIGDDDDYDFSDDDEDDGDYNEDDEVFFQVKCPTCENELTIGDSILEQGGITCPNCGEELEFDLGDDDGECDCGHHN